MGTLCTRKRRQEEPHRTGLVAGLTSSSHWRSRDVGEWMEDGAHRSGVLRTGAIALAMLA
jgi:hypothetical protein